MCNFVFAMVNILYIHGMKGGADSRIPLILSDYFRCNGGVCCDVHLDVNVVCRTYSFDPRKATEQISSMIEELRPSLVIAESLGASHAFRIDGIPRIFVSPALGAPMKLYSAAPFSRIPLIRRMLEKKYAAPPGDRQKIVFDSDILKAYKPHFEAARKGMENFGPYDFAFFGSCDHYLKNGVVSIDFWERKFGKDTFQIYDGIHNMEEKYIYSLLIPKIVEILLNLQNVCE